MIFIAANVQMNEEVASNQVHLCRMVAAEHLMIWLEESHAWRTCRAYEHWPVWSDWLDRQLFGLMVDSSVDLLSIEGKNKNKNLQIIFRKKIQECSTWDKPSSKNENCLSKLSMFANTWCKSPLQIECKLLNTSSLSPPQPPPPTPNRTSGGKGGCCRLLPTWLKLANGWKCWKMWVKKWSWTWRKWSSWKRPRDLSSWLLLLSSSLRLIAHNLIGRQNFVFLLEISNKQKIQYSICDWRLCNIATLANC